MGDVLEAVRRELWRTLEPYPTTRKYFRRLEENRDVEELQRLANVMTTQRLGYNDHGRVHAYIVSRNAVRILEILEEKGIQPNIVKDGLGDFEDAITTVVLAAFLHDIGNAIHRAQHGIHSEVLALPILQEVLDDHPRKWVLLTTALEAIYAHNEDVAITIEAGAVKVADGTDMAQGRARVPYRLGVFDTHMISALSIKRVDLEPGRERPLRIVVDMEHSAGVFQVEYVLGEKIKSSSLRGMVEVLMRISHVGERMMYF